MSNKPKRTRFGLAVALTAALALCLTGVAVAAPNDPYFNGFETDTGDWSVPNTTRVASGTNGIDSASGGFHAQVNDDYTYWGTSDDPTTFPASGFTTSLDIYLDPAAITANDTRFDWDSAIGDSSGNHRRDFVFNGGGYTDTDSTGSGPRFVISASNNAGRSGAFPKNPDRSPFTITDAGWYRFQHRFYDDNGVLAVEMSILDSNGNVLTSWTLSNPADTTATTGGGIYGWVATNEFPFLAIDNSRLALVAPASASQCKNDGWSMFTMVFKNQGDCVSYVNSQR